MKKKKKKEVRWLASLSGQEQSCCVQVMLSTGLCRCGRHSAWAVQIVARMFAEECVYRFMLCLAVVQWIP